MGNHGHSATNAATHTRGVLAARGRAPAAPEPTLTYSHTVRVDQNVHASADARRRVDRHVLAYHGSDGHEYRKSIETAKGAELRTSDQQYPPAASAVAKSTKSPAQVEAQRQAEMSKLFANAAEGLRQHNLDERLLERAQREIGLARADAFNRAKETFDAVVADVRAAGDPATSCWRRSSRPRSHAQRRVAGLGMRWSTSRDAVGRDGAGRLRRQPHAKRPRPR